MLQWNRWWRLCHMSGHAHSCLCLPACVLYSSHCWCCALPLEGPPSSLVKDTHFSSLCYWVLPMASLAAFLWYKPPAASVRNIESSQVIIIYPPSLGEMVNSQTRTSFKTVFIHYRLIMDTSVKLFSFNIMIIFSLLESNHILNYLNIITWLH